MNALAFILQFVFAFLGFLLSPQGVFAVLLGLVGFVALPIIPRVSGRFKSFSSIALGLAVGALGRVAIVVSEHGDLLLKRMSFDDLGVETIRFGSETKEFEDPANALHYWRGAPFALADEVRGVLFDPRHAALGNRKADAEEREEWSVWATTDEWDQHGIEEWKRGVFEFPETHELVDLSGVRKLIDGGERAEYPQRIEELYKHSRAPFESGASGTKFILLLVALLAPFALMWVLAGQSSGGGGGGTTVGFGSAVLALSLSRINWKDAAIALVVLLPVPLTLLAIAVFVSPFVAIFTLLALGIGFAMIPLASVFTRLSDRLATKYARAMFKLGLLSYDRPVFEWTPTQYRLREADELETTDDVTWYGLAGSTVGFTFEPSSDSWGAEHTPREELEAGRDVAADGGETQSHIPAGYAPLPSVKRAGHIGAFVPTQLRSDRYYISTAIALGRWRDSANGEKTLKRLLQSKEKHGQGSELSDRTMILAMLAGGTVSTVLGVFVFFL